MKYVTAFRVASLAIMAGDMGCSSEPASLSTLSPTSPSMSVTAANFTYVSFGVPVSYSVNGAFHYSIQFTVPSAGAYQVSAIGNTQIVGCSGRYCMSPGTLKATISGAQVQTAGGAAVATIAGTTSVTLAPGNYVLVVDGTGAGTKRYAGQGNFTVTIRAPAVVLAPSCDYVRDLLQTQGYTDVQIEAIVASMQAASPPKCLGD